MGSIDINTTEEIKPIAFSIDISGYSPPPLLGSATGAVSRH